MITTQILLLVVTNILSVIGGDCYDNVAIPTGANDRYIAVEQRNSWANADTFCQNTFGTNLATVITDSDASNFLTIVDRLENYNNFFFWGGLNDIDGDGLWGWSSGSQCTIPSGATPEPCDPRWATLNPSDGVCAQIIGDSSNVNSVWRPRTCSNTICVLCDRHKEYVTVNDQGPKTWAEANAYCALTYGTELATITDDRDAAQLLYLRLQNVGWLNSENCGPTNIGFWIGLNDNNDDNAYTYTDGYVCGGSGCNSQIYWGDANSEPASSGQCVELNDEWSSGAPGDRFEINRILHTKDCSATNDRFFCNPPQGCVDCCYTNNDCDDGNPCTDDVCAIPNPPPCAEGQDCDVAISGTCEYTEVSNCCVFDQECDAHPSDPCQFPICANNECTYTGPDIGIEEHQCCRDDNDCSDGNTPCAVAVCDSFNQCFINEIPNCPPECMYDQDCPDDGNMCTADTCVDGACVNTLVVGPGCCEEDLDCDDSNICTIDLCVSNQCTNTPKPNCCDDMYGPSCPGGDVGCYDCVGNQCIITTPGCDPCTDNSDCSDGLVCTIDTCVDFQCDHQPVGHEDCCEPPSSPWAPPACDDHDVCTTDTCVQYDWSYQCQYDVDEECCTQNSDCNDYDVCTQDLCVDNQCVLPHPPVENCCEYDRDCDDYVYDPYNFVDSNNDCEEVFCDMSTNQCDQRTDPMCCVAGKNVNWWALENGATLEERAAETPEITCEVYRMTNSLGFSFQIHVPYLGLSYDPFSNHYGLGTTFVIDFQSFKEYTPSFPDQIGNCQNRLFQDFETETWADIWGFDSDPYDSDGGIQVGDHEINLAYPAVPNCWEIDAEDNCEPVLHYVGNFPWKTLSQCISGRDSWQRPLIHLEEEEDYIRIWGTLYVSMVSPYSQDYDTGHYRVYPLVQRDFEFNILRTIDELSSTGVKLFTGEIISLYEADAEGSFFISVLVQSLDYLQLENAALNPISGGGSLIFGEADSGSIHVTESTNGECLQSSPFSCGQIFNIEIHRDLIECDTSQNPLGTADFSGIFCLVFDTICRATDSSPLCTHWDQQMIQIDIESYFKDVSCDPLVYNLEFVHSMVFFDDPIFQIPHGINPYSIGDRIYVKMTIDIPCDDCDHSVNIFKVEIENVFVCVLFDEYQLSLNPSMGNPGGCLDPSYIAYEKFDGPYCVIMGALTNSPTMNYGAKIYDMGNTMVAFSFLAFPIGVGQEVEMYVHVQAKLSLADGSTRRVLLQTDGSPSSEQIGHFTESTTIANDESEGELNSTKNVSENGSSHSIMIVAILFSVVAVVGIVGFILYRYLSLKKSVIERQLKELQTEVTTPISPMSTGSAESQTAEPCV